MGGGLGIRYRDEQPLGPARSPRRLSPLLGPLGLSSHLEPGRYLVGAAGILLTTVLYRKHSGGKDFVIVDAGMSDLVRPSHYMAYHDIVHARAAGRGAASGGRGRADLRERATSSPSSATLPAVEQGDTLAILGAGAYGFVMGSNYNARPRPAEVLVDGDAGPGCARRETRR